MIYYYMLKMINGVNPEINLSENGQMWEKKIVKRGPKGPHVIKNKCLSEFMINEWPNCIIGD